MSGSGKGPLRIAIEDFIATFDILKPVKTLLSGLLTWMEDENIKVYAELVSVFGLEGKLPPEYSPATFAKLVKTAPAGFWVSVTGIVGLLLGGFMGIAGPARRRAEYAVDNLQHTYRPDPSTSWAMLRRNPGLEHDLRQGLSEQGMNDSQFDYWGKITEQLLPGIQLEQLRLRGLIDNADYLADMQAQGYTPERILEIQSIVKQIPGPGDLISMAVREAWDDTVSARFSYDVGLPEPFVEWMTKQGYSADWCKRYWRQHWVLPGVSQAYEMLHRLRPGVSETPFTADDMASLLKTADIPEFFRDRLVAISYNPYTRVDVRRLYGTGVITESQVKSNYLDLGYDEEHATNLTTFTCQGAKAEEKGVTPSVITGLYHDALLGRDAAKTMLTDLGYSPENAEYLLLLVDVSLDQANVNAQLADIQTRYVDGELDESALQGALGPLNLASDRQTQLLAKWQILRRNHIKRPSSSQLEAFYKLGLIDAATYTAGLLAAGYLSPDAELFLSQTDTEIQTAAVKEAARAQTAADGAVTSTTATPDKIQLAQLDVDIAYDRLQIANAKVASHAELTPEQQKTLADQVDLLNIDIADLNYQKAQVHLAAI
jgi:hypothetical protein